VLETIAAALGGKLFDAFFGNIRGVLKDFQDRKISEAEFAEKLKEAFLGSFTQVETAHADLTAKTFESFQQTLRTSTLMQTAWCWMVYTQLFVLFWHQWCVPFLVFVIRQWQPTFQYPSSGSTVEWAYLLLAFLFGAGAVVLRNGPGEGDMLSRLKNAVGLR
jgi:hypothetical protein